MVFRLITLGSALLFSCALLAQSTFPSYKYLPHSIWQFQYGDVGADNSYHILGSNFYGLGVQPQHMLRTTKQDEAGNVLFATELYNIDYDLLPLGIGSRPDGGQIIAAQQKNNELFLFGVDAAGELDFSKMVDLGSMGIYAVKAGTNGKFFVLAHQPNTGEHLALSFNPDGTLFYYRNFSWGTEPLWGHRMFQRPGGNLVVAARKGSASQVPMWSFSQYAHEEPSSAEWYVAELCPMGGPIRGSALTMPVPMDLEHITEDASGRILLTGRTMEDVTSRDKDWTLITMPNNGNLPYGDRFGTPGWDYGCAVQPLENGSYILTGVLEPGADQRCAVALFEPTENEVVAWFQEHAVGAEVVLDLNTFGPDHVAIGSSRYTNYEVKVVPNDLSDLCDFTPITLTHSEFVVDEIGNPLITVTHAAPVLLDFSVETEHFVVDPHFLCTALAVSPQPRHGTLQTMPNPASWQLTVTLPEGSVSNNVRIYSIDGKQQSAPTQLFGRVAQLDVSELAPGMYLVVSTATNGATYTSRIVVE